MQLVEQNLKLFLTLVENWSNSILFCGIQDRLSLAIKNKRRSASENRIQDENKLMMYSTQTPMQKHFDSGKAVEGGEGA